MNAPLTPQPESRAEALVGSERRRWLRAFAFVLAILIPVLAACLYAWFYDPPRLAKALRSVGDFLTRAFPPSFTEWREWVRPFLDTLVMSIAGTFLATCAALPLSFLAARNTSPHPAVYYAMRAVLTFFRAVPDIVAALVFVVAFGFGLLPGTLALALHSTGVLGKFFSEIIEHVDPAPIEAIKATGARTLQVLYHGYILLALPQLADAALYRFECNFRNSMILGIVGAGGIGFQLYLAHQVLKYREMMGILIVLVVFVTLVDVAGSLLRKAIK